MRELVLAIVLAWALIGCADPCAELGEPALTLGTTNADATSFVPFEDGAELELQTGPQIGMHVWLNLRVVGLCPPELDVDRRVLNDATEELVEIQRGRLDLVEDTEPGAWVLDRPVPMILCPPALPIVGERLRFAVRAEDATGRYEIAMKPFVAVCPSGACEICTPL